MALTRISQSQGQGRQWPDGHPTWTMRHRLRKQRDTKAPDILAEPTYTARGTLLPAVSSLEITV
ncbi:MAG: hypothetical protein EOL86_12040 [Deltaproteobacteria bacterium]|nr:hypothetical protein [Deltaproteobacteria bacterium]